MDLQKNIRMVVDTGKTQLGTRKGKLMALNGKAKLLIISKNCPKATVDEILHDCDRSKTPYFVADFTSMEIGSICGKPFPVSILSVIDAGNSEILKLTEKGTVIETGGSGSEVKETKSAAKKRSKAARREKKEETATEEASESEIESEGKSDVEAEQ